MTTHAEGHGGAHEGGASAYRRQCARALAERIDARSATVGVIGLGYVGLPLLSAVHAAGFGVVGLDNDPEKIAVLRAGGNYLPHLGDELARELAASPRATLTSDERELSRCDVVLICVPTPLDEKNEPDLSYVEKAARTARESGIGNRESGEAASGSALTGGIRQGRMPPIRAGRLVVLESTTYPGTTRDVVLPILQQGLSDAQREAVFAAFSPEREDPGNPTHSTRTIPKLVGGVDAESGALAQRFYGAVVQRVVACASAEVAEAAKLLENVYRAVNIALVNELKIAFDAMGIDVWDVIDAASTKPFGFARFNPGPGFGGHCVPIDPFYLSWIAQKAGAPARFIELAGVVNRLMPGFVVGKCAAALARSRGVPEGEALRGARVLVLGLAYKPDIADVRESPSFELIELLREEGALVAYHDPHVPRTWKGRRHDPRMESVKWSAEELASRDAVIIATDHAWYDWDFVGTHARLIVDTRNAMSRSAGAWGAKVVKA